MVIDLNNYSPPITYNTEILLNLIDEISIYKYYLGVVDITKKVKNPFRKDTHPSFFLFYSDKSFRLVWKDFGTNETGNCITLVAKLFHISYFEAINKIAMDFGLTKGENKISRVAINESNLFKDQFKSKNLLIQIERKPFTNEELEYWATYTINKKELLENNIFSIQSVWLNKKKLYLPNELRFAYYFDQLDKWKIYTPFNKEFKWFGNVSTKTVEGLEKLDITKPVIIQKSRKDAIVMRKIYPNVVNTQNEADTSITPEVDLLLQQCPERYVFWDADQSGVNACKKLNVKGYKYFNVPKKYYVQHGCKDISDLVQNYGFEKAQDIVLNEMSKKGLIINN